MLLGLGISIDDNRAHVLVGDRPEGHFEYAGTTPLALLDAPRACSRRNLGCVRMSITSLGSSGLQRSLDYAHLVSSNVEHEHVS
jgi:hypothetical protein